MNGMMRTVAIAAVLFCGIGCTTQEGDTTVILPGVDGGTAPAGECVPGVTGVCGGFGGHGQCTNGSRLCGPDGTWGHCIGEGAPSPEVCDAVDNDCDGQIDDGIDCGCNDEIEVCGDHRDNNCNGEVDEGCTCTPGVAEPCVSPLPGACAIGTMRCRLEGVSFTECIPNAAPALEICDGVDNDCDGIADEDVCDCTAGASRSCLTGLLGACHNGQQTCTAGGRGFGPCLPTVTESAEVCGDGVDNDCDGTADEGCECTSGASRPCVSPLPGVCAAGLQACTASVWGFCIPTAAATSEVCDGRDNDCDGTADEEVCRCTPGATQACHSGLLGVCDIGSQTCSGDGRGWSTCLSSNVPSRETCDGIDNDCDGIADDDGVCTCTPAEIRACSSGLSGVCSAGTQRCRADGRSFDPCVASATAGLEVCDGRDNDCDGIADEDVCACTPLAPRPCLTGLPGACSAGNQTCTADGRGYGSCLPTSAPGLDVCGDGIDNDCDGTADEGCVCAAGASRPCTTTLSGICSAGRQTCDLGLTWGSCIPTAAPLAEVCDGLDNDCDGIADEDVCACTPLAPRPCLTGLPGQCAAGQQTCSASGRGYSVCLPTSGPTSETCDGIDNDCDGTADEEVCACIPGSFQICLTGLFGECADGFQFCSADGRGFEACQAFVLPWLASPDVCGDGVDNDCDGTADEGCTCTGGAMLSCVSNLPGRCSAGTETCTADGHMYGDCIPTNGAIPETCNGIDDDCDGVADEDVCACTPLAPRPCLTGLPGACSAGNQTCTADGRGFGSCLPTSAPGPDVCGDGIDNDCDGNADEDCVCTPGASQACITGLDGACSAGNQTCDAGHAWSPCLPSAGPSSEVCDGIDNDCDGNADDDGVCTCTVGASAGCLTGLAGVCATGQHTCTAGGRGFTACLPTTGASPEICDGLDNDCDGVADEDVCTCTAGLARACNTGIPGVCMAGSQTCDASGRGWGPCLTAVVRSADVCGDGLDNDCDGTADEDCVCTSGASRPCVAPLPGVCAAGLQACTGGRWDACIPTAAASSEVCDGRDNDCDGIADEGVCACTPLLPRACLTGLPGACSAGSQQCTADGRGFGPCLPTSAPAPDVCGDGADNDCDGTADEGCACTPGASRSCTTGFFGQCGMGTQSCDAGRSWTPCLPSSGPTSETCDGTDNDCDGVADEEVCTCTPLSTRGCSSGLTGVCSAGSQTCSADGRSYSVCLPTTGASLEVCDGLDNDCDGVADEEVCSCVPGTSRACETAGLGACRDGVQTCTADGRGYDPCVASSGPSAETCNGRDDDCDGIADEDVCTCPAGVPRGCITGLDGVCSAGTQSCSADGRGYNACLPTTGPSVDVCGDGIDNDCDGTADDGCVCTAGASRTCLTGGFGACSAGLQTCDAGRSWTPCLPTSGPSSDACNGFDDDCDGLADEDGVCTCTVGASAGCLTGLPGACAPGAMTCIAGGRGFTACLPTAAPSPEVCNGFDDDCDGVADEDGVCTCTPFVAEVCSTGLPGACGPGSHTCRADGRGFGPCTGAVPVVETCPGDGIDSDCDGTADEGCVCGPGTVEPCLTGLLGLCTMGTMTCRADGHSFTACLPTSGPVSEIPSNGTDDDCNGITDDVAACVPGAIINCATGLTSICARGEQTCLPSGAGYGPCVLLTGGNPEVCGDAIDNNCNGQVNEGCACAAGSSLSCSTGMSGVCAAGATTCLADGSGYGPCAPITFGSAEVCDGLDNDCNGVIDNGAACP